MREPDIRAVVVDYGGVISLRPTAEQLRRLHSLCGLGAARFGTAWLEHRREYDMGLLSAAEYWARVTNARHEPARLEAIAAADADSWAATSSAMIDWLRELKAAGLLVALLSNMPREVWHALERVHTWLELCDAIILSWEHRAAKPDAALFQRCLDRLAIRAEETLFVDDTPENVEAAAALGIHAVLYEDVAGLRTALATRYAARLPLPLPPRS